MNISLYWDVATPAVFIVPRSEKTLSFKNRLGTKPSHLMQSVHINMPDKIHKKWKDELRLKINGQFRKDARAKIIVDERHVFNLSARSGFELANNIANAILRIRKGDAGYNHIDNYKEDNKIYKTIG